jgi:hypothetical protein
MGNTGSVLRVRCWKCGELAGKVGRLAGKISARLAAHTRSRAAGWAADSQRLLRAEFLHGCRNDASALQSKTGQF